MPDGRAQLVHTQARALARLLRELAESNPFYRPRLGWTGGLNLDALPDEELLQRFAAETPFTTKAEIVADQAACPPYGTNLTYALERYTRYSQTSGTTGAPLRWLDTPESWDWMVGNWAEVLKGAGVTSHDRVFFAFSFGPFLGFWTAFEAALRMGCMCLPGGGMSSVARLRAIVENRATVLCCTPTYALHLGEVAAEEQPAPGHLSVRSVLVAGEPGGAVPATRERISALWHGARVWDHHGMTEIGPVSLECSAVPGRLHVLERSFVPEVVDPRTGALVPEGARGELVLTNLGRSGSPLLRYRTGDIVCASRPQPCACGRWDLALDGGILGRADDMVVVRGVNLYPSAVEEVVRRFAEVAEYRVELRTSRSMAEAALVVEPRVQGAPAVGLARRLEHALRDAFNLRVPVRLVGPGELPRFEMKASRWVRMEEGNETRG